MSYYTKRALLGGIYTSTELYMTQDKSKDFQSTWQFLQDRFRDSQKIGNLSGNAKRLSSWTRNSIFGILSSVLYIQFE
jgi:ubiquinone biosynthesis protein COQ9